MDSRDQLVAQVTPPPPKLSERATYLGAVALTWATAQLLEGVARYWDGWHAVTSWWSP